MNKTDISKKELIAGLLVSIDETEQILHKVTKILNQHSEMKKTILNELLHGVQENDVTSSHFIS